ncbi:flagellar assembly protein FliW [Bacillus sp. V5-8f]|uniref:flagellar assembly protein FliW n=1 Tax=Bacillus sp. V5-8f TaxID=2053044 RepID=UPI000C7793E0|nr:flagellar assembly protein FliW [Bacillus sp. V5-8f]PLT35706.1 flagellar assembly protein FliW [Bacillus sp. V5-8f]
MKLFTKYHGETEVEENKIITFEKGLPGFGEETSFTILPLAEEADLFILQSTQTPGLAFVISTPFSFFKEYDFTLDDATVEQLQLESTEQVQVFSILTVQDPFEKTTANLQAPIVISSVKRLAKQVILNHPDYKTKHPLFVTAKER